MPEADKDEDQRPVIRYEIPKIQPAHVRKKKDHTDTDQ
jgi:hypothetical protein